MTVFYGYLTKLSIFNDLILGKSHNNAYLCRKIGTVMRIKIFKKRAITKLLTLLGFGTTAFVFAACYGTVPNRYMEKSYSDSIRAVFEGEDTLTVNVSDDTAADDLLHHEDASHSPDNSGSTYN